MDNPLREITIMLDPSQRTRVERARMDYETAIIEEWIAAHPLTVSDCLTVPDVRWVLSRALSWCEAALVDDQIDADEYTKARSILAALDADPTD